MIPDWLPVVILAIPLLAAVVCAILPRRLDGIAHAVAAVPMAVATALSVWMAQLALPSPVAQQGPHLTWLDLGSFALGAGVSVDGIAAVMTVIVCGLATAVLVYNSWYMHEDRLRGRFPWQFCFFTFAMLGVVLSDNLFQSFVFWELVGLGSYLLIGFWFDKPPAAEDPEYLARRPSFARGVLEDRLSPAHAQLKAFVMNRVGDAGFLCGIGVLLVLGVAAGHAHEPLGWHALNALATGTLPQVSVFGMSGQALLTLAALGVFCGAVGKSAQFPLHPWLPDAMQGPTTASSMIHAATMVAAGVYLVARSYVLFTPDALIVVGWTGGITCVIAAMVACVQWDLKAVLAWSTISQLGLMFVALGSGSGCSGDATAITHLFTHALFKCLLFLCAGAVIHACHGVQDLHRMGGLRRRMPVTAVASLCGVLAICGMPLFSGSLSKDGILASALARTEDLGVVNTVPFVLACVGSLLTVVYMLRFWIRIFGGEERDASVTDHAHDPAPSAKIVLGVLLPLTLVFPWKLLGEHVRIDSIRVAEVEHHAEFIALGLLGGGAAIALTIWLILPARGIDAGAILARRLRPLWNLCASQFGIDRLEQSAFAQGLGSELAHTCAHLDLGTSRRLDDVDVAGAARASDLASIDGLVDGLGRACARTGRIGALVHAGRIGTYIAIAAITGSAILLVFLLR
ncbi:MAG: proton-conducting transporter membrane subunit [Planctomycetota bacterium]